MVCHLRWRLLSCHQRIAKILRFLRENSADGIVAQEKAKATVITTPALQPINQ